MALVDEEDKLLALPIERAAKLAGVSIRRLRYWDQTGLVVPSIKRTLGKRSTVRLYGFGDLVDLLVVALILHEGISLRHVRKVVAYLRERHYETPLRELRFAVYGDEIYFQHPDGSWEGGRQPHQLVLHHVIPLQQIVARIRGSAERSPDAAGRVVRRRKVMGRQPVFEGTRIPVATVVGYLERGYTTERIIEAFPVLTAADVDEARKQLGAAQVRFFLDNNVDTAVRTVLFSAGHISWTAASAGLAAANDDSIAVYADEKDAVLVSHDKAFAERHKRNTTGKHLWLRCEPPDAGEIVRRHLPEILKQLASLSNVVVEVSAERVRLHPPRWK